MKQLNKFKSIASGLTLSVALLAGTAAAVNAAPTAPAQAAPRAAAPPTSQLTSGPQARPPVEPGTKDAKVLKSLGSTNLVATDDGGKPQAAAGKVTALAGNVSGVDFQSSLNYCYRNLVYTPVKNTTAAVKYVQIRVYNEGSYREIYTSVAANGAVAYPAFYGINRAYTAYLYVWNGSSYQYDEYLSGNNNCNVSVTRVYNTGGWVQLKIQNIGTAYASQLSTELAPYPGSGTYTGSHYDYPVAGGAAIYRWFQVGTQPYGITSSTSGSFNAPRIFTGDL